VADGQVYLLRKGRDLDVEVASLAIAARRWARAGLQAHHPQRVRRAAGGPKVGLYVRFEPAGGRQRRRRANG
jgi:hypothetical protein